MIDNKGSLSEGVAADWWLCDETRDWVFVAGWGGQRLIQHELVEGESHVES